MSIKSRILPQIFPQSRLSAVRTLSACPSCRIAADPLQLKQAHLTAFRFLLLLLRVFPLNQIVIQTADKI